MRRVHVGGNTSGRIDKPRERARDPGFVRKLSELVGARVEHMSRENKNWLPHEDEAIRLAITPGSKSGATLDDSSVELIGEAIGRSTTAVRSRFNKFPFKQQLVPR